MSFELADHIAQSLGPHAFRFTAGLVLRGSERRVDVGSGVFIQIGSRYFVATAAHNIVEFPDTQIGLVHEEQPHGEFGSFIGRSPGLHESYPLDLGYLELAPDAPDRCGKDFLPLSRLRPNCAHVGNEGAYVLGYPAATSGVESPRLLALGAVGAATLTEKPDEIENVDPDVDIVLAYSGDHIDSETGRIAPPVEPEGLSGSGIWAIPGLVESKLWSAEDLVLIGIQNRRRRRSELILGIQIQHWLALVSSRYPELRGVIEAVV